MAFRLGTPEKPEREQRVTTSVIDFPIDVILSNTPDNNMDQQTIIIYKYIQSSTTK